MKPLVSILIPAYNAEHWISDTLRSAIAQTWPRKEIIVVDDGSSDRTLDMARKFKNEGVRVFSQKNQGAAAARNSAFSLSQGDYIQWLDADDLLAPDQIERQMDLIMRNPGKRWLVSSAWARFMYRHYRARFIPTALWCDLSPTEWLVRKMGQNLYMQTASWLVSREMTAAAGPWNMELLGDDDGEYFCRVLLNSEEVPFVPDARVYYRASGSGSLSYVGLSDRKRQAHWRSMLLHIGYLRSLEDTPRTRAACIRYVRCSLMYFYPERPDIVAQAQQLAHELGGELGEPRFSWKYSWIKKLFGPRLAKRAQLVLPRVRWSAVRSLDKALFRIGRRRHPRAHELAQ